MGKRFRLICRAPANVVFQGEENLLVTVNHSDGAGTVKLMTRRIPDTEGKTFAGDFGAIIDAPADDIRSSLRWINIARDLAALVEITANANVGPLELEIAFEATAEPGEKPFLQVVRQADQPAITSRLVPMKATAALLDKVNSSPYRDALTRAMAQYSRALSYARLGSELSMVAHLWIGIEALKGAVVEAKMASLGVNEDGLAKAWGFSVDRRMKIREFLLAEARARVICKDDRELHREAKRVSDSYEHSFTNAGSLYTPAEKIVKRLAECLRSAVFELAGLDPEIAQALYSAPYKDPRGPLGVELYLWGDLTKEPSADPAAVATYPHFAVDAEMEVQQTDAHSDATGFPPLKVNLKCTPRAEPGFKLELKATEHWDGGSITAPAVLRAEIKDGAWRIALGGEDRPAPPE